MLREITSAKNSILYNIRKGYEDIKNKIKMQTVTEISELEIETKLGLTKPFETYEEFINFDSFLADENNYIVMVIFAYSSYFFVQSKSNLSTIYISVKKLEKKIHIKKLQ